MQPGIRVSWLLTSAQARGRGSHVRAYGIVTKVNPKTVDITEAAGSYRPGTLWRVAKSQLRVDNI